jgi:RHS repeat-associated protein
MSRTNCLSRDFAKKNSTPNTSSRAARCLLHALRPHRIVSAGDPISLRSPNRLVIRRIAGSVFSLFWVAPTRSPPAVIAAGQLTSLTYTQGATTLGTATYKYDAAANRTEVGGAWARIGLPPALASATYDAGNRIATWGGTTFTYDFNGNLTSDGSTTYTWNARNQLVGLTGGATGSYAYDGFGRRRAKTTGGTLGFLYDGANVVQELSASTPSANLLSGLAIDETLIRTDATSATALLTDALGSTLALANMAGSVETQFTYEPFGATSASGAASANRMQFTGRENDGGGLHYYRARYYSSRLQRFLSEDPIRFAGGVNLYEYVGSNPVKFTDPSGLFSCPVHAAMTMNAALSFGLPPADYVRWAVDNCGVDFYEESMSSLAQHTNRHGMAGRKGSNEWQTCNEAYRAAEDYLREFMQDGKMGDALHLIQDQFSPYHRYQRWAGLIHPETARHVYRDFVPDPQSLQMARDATTRFLEDYLAQRLGQPSRYLHNFCR